MMVAPSASGSGERESRLPRRAVDVVLCDDFPEFRALIRAGLAEDPSIEVVGEAGTGEEAIDRVLSTGADVVLLDLRMPGRITGLETVSVVRAEAPRCAIVVLSRFPQWEGEARDAGADIFVEKGAGAADVRAAVHEAARRRKPDGQS